MGINFFVNNDVFHNNIDKYYEAHYLKGVVNYIKKEYSTEGGLSIYFYLNVDFSQTEIVANKGDNNNKICVIIDEYYEENAGLLETFSCVFQAYLKEIKSPHNYHHFPLGYSYNFISSSIVALSKRTQNVFFIGNCHIGRKAFFKAISWLGFLPFAIAHRIQTKINIIYDDLWPSSYIRFTSGFGKGLNAVEYSALLHNSKIVLCPEGVSNIESYRLYEAMKAGCLVVSTPLPKKSFYLNAPIYQLKKWTDLEELVSAILSMKEEVLDQKQSEVIKWWDSHLSEEAVAMYMLKIIG